MFYTPAVSVVVLYLFPTILTLSFLISYVVSANITQEIRIIGGSYAINQNNFSYQVTLTKFGKHFCGGSIIHLEYILTAAHCVYDTRKPSDITVYLGSLQKGDGMKIKVKNIFVHPGYNTKNLRHDIAILKIPSLGNFTDNIRNVPLANSSPKPGVICTVAGWGVTETSESGTYYLKYANVPIISSTRCRLSYKDQLKREMFCAGYLEGGSDACQGDSGGGLICDKTLTGVVSWGHECGAKSYPGVYTDVSFYTDWIHSKSNSFQILSAPAVTLISLFSHVFLLKL